jgi:hypothetical protein
LPSPATAKAPGFFSVPQQRITTDNKGAPRMKPVPSDLLAPQAQSAFEPVRSGRDGVWWERGDGLRVQLAAPESAPTVERTRLSLLGMLVAYLASSPRQR